MGIARVAIVSFQLSSFLKVSYKLNLAMGREGAVLAINTCEGALRHDTVHVPLHILHVLKNSFIVDKAYYRTVRFF